MYGRAQLRPRELHSIRRRVAQHFEQVIDGQINRFGPIKLGNQTTQYSEFRRDG